MTEAGLFRDERATGETQAEWDLWRFRAEGVLGYSVTDGDQVDALYQMYLQDIEPERAAAVLIKAMSIAVEAHTIIQNTRRGRITMREENEFDRFQAHPERLPPVGQVPRLRRKACVLWGLWAVCVGFLMWGLWLGRHAQ